MYSCNFFLFRMNLCLPRSEEGVYVGVIGNWEST